jgi:hypothetical protein
MYSVFLLFRYGEYRQSIVNLVIQLKPRTTTTLSPSSPSSSSSSSSAAAATGDPTASALTPHIIFSKINTTSSSSNSSSSVTSSAVADYEYQFFILRVIVLGTIGCVFSVLGLTFWIYFVYLWRTWDSAPPKRDPIPASETFDEEKPSEKSETEGDNNDEAAPEPHPHFNRALMRSR